MNKLMVEQAGARFFDLASSMGRMHVETLTGLADATAKTPFGPIFAANATVARMVNEGVETIAHSFVGENGADPQEKVTPRKAAAPKAKSASKVAKAPKPVTKADKATKPAQKKAADNDTSDETATLLAIEPEADEVLIDEAEAIDIIASTDVDAVTKPDDLTVISGIGATTAKKLNGAGVMQFTDIAAMNESKFVDLLASLDIKSIRFSPAKWIEEAKMFAAKAN